MNDNGCFERMSSKTFTWLIKYFSNITRTFFNYVIKGYLKKIITIIMWVKKVELEHFRKCVKMMIPHNG